VGPPLKKRTGPKTPSCLSIDRRFALLESLRLDLQRIDRGPQLFNGIRGRRCWFHDANKSLQLTSLATSSEAYELGATPCFVMNVRSSDLRVPVARLKVSERSRRIRA